MTRSKTDIDPRILGLLLSAQSTISVFSVRQRMGEFVCRAIEGIPGVGSCTVCMPGAERPLLGGEPIPECADCHVPEGDIDHVLDLSCRLPSCTGLRVFPLRTQDWYFGFCLLKVSAPDEFAPYDPFVSNLIDGLAVNVERLLQKESLRVAHDELLKHRDHLQELVGMRTAELAATNESLQAEVAERKRTQDELSESTEKLQNIFDAAPVAITTYGMDKRILSCNENFCHTIGFTEDELKKLAIKDIMHPEDIDDWQVKINGLLKSEYKITTGQRRFIRKDGKVLWAETNVVLMRNSQGEPLYFLSAAQIITERRLAEEAQALNTQRIQTLLKLNQMTRSSLQEITDFALEEAVRLTQSKIGYLAFLNEDESVLTMHSWSKSAMAECATIDKPIIYPVKSTGLWGEAVRQRKAVFTNDYSAPNPLKKGHPQGHVVLKRHMNAPIFDGSRIVIVAGVGNKAEEYDMSDVQQLTLLMESMWRLIERKRAEDKIRDIGHQWQKTFDASNDLFMLMDTDFKITRANAQTAKLLGMPLSSIIGRPCYELMHCTKKPHPDCPATKLLSSNKHEETELFLEGKNLWASVSVDPYYDEAGQLVGFVHVVRDITERKSAEKILATSEKRYRELLTNLEAGVVVHAPDTSIITCNPRASELLGLSEDQMKGKLALDPDWKFLNDNNTPMALNDYPVNRIIASKAAFKDLSCGVNRPVTKDVAWLIVNGFPVLNNNGKITEILISFIDITKRKLAEDNLWQKNLVFDASIAANSIADMKGNITEANEAFLKIWGYPSKDEVLGKPLLNFINDPKEAIGIVTALNNLGEWEGDYTAKRKDGSTFIAHGLATTLMDSSGDLIGYQSAVIDVTKHQADEQELKMHKEQLETLVAQRTTELQDSQKKFKTLIDFTYDWEYWIAPDRNMIYISPACERISGYTAEEFYTDALLIDRLIHHDDSDAFKNHVDVFHLGKKRAESKELEFKIICKDGTVRWISHACRPVTSDDGTFLGRRVSNRDITERVKNVEALQQKTGLLEAANKELEAFAYSVSHDLRAPLRTIDGFSQALIEDSQDKLDDTCKGHIVRVRAATQRMGELIDDILNLSRISRAELQIQDVDLSQIAQSIDDELKSTNPGRLVEFIKATGVRIKGDKNLLKIALENLIGNAWKFTSKKDHAKIEFGVQKTADKVIYFVRDNGAGFDMAFSNKLFIPFQRLHAVTEFPGTGIGLAFVQRIVRKHQGNIWAEGVKDQGATFYFTLFDEKGPEAI